MKKTAIILVLIARGFAPTGLYSQGGDKFAKIGSMQGAVRMHLLEEKVPGELPAIKLPVTNEPNSRFTPFQLMDTEEELDAELKRMREKYLPFMENYAPGIRKTRNQIRLDSFLWRIETETDVSNFSNVLNGEGNWEIVQIPHYGPPLGRAVTYYFKKITIPAEMIQKGSLFVCFKGVDYKAHVFMNGSFLGSHEGFFAPFEFDFSKHARPGENILVVKVENDYTTTGGKDKNGDYVIGDKIYAASGPGYDDPELGWHHCPPGMGIYQDCYIESRDPLHINDVFVRPLVNSEEAEIWLEVNNFHPDLRDITLEFSLYGQNFKKTIFENLEYIPTTTYIPGLGDLAKPVDWTEMAQKAGFGENYFKIKVPVKDPRLWCNETPWLYQLQVRVIDNSGSVTDEVSARFGMRSFTMDTMGKPKGMMYLNGEKIRLRGANTMGYMQQDVMKKDWDQLINDILLAKICRLNFIRLTQRPVQEEIYNYCDRLGLMLQTDLPLFGSLRPNQFSEGIKQAGEMERLVRKHPSNIMVTYINERFPNAEGYPHRGMPTAGEYNKFFAACDQVVLFANPDRVIKAGDGDYDPPVPGLPDSHCYNAWYNGHGLGLGELHKGHWQPVKPGWYYACGEFGAEGLDPVTTMKKYYPEEWLPGKQNNWSPLQIKGAQTQAFHYMWFNTQHSIEDWVEASQKHQEWAVRFQTEAMRRDTNMVSFAIHLFIDAWPAGWMKTIMDVDRRPKKAFFAYRDALTPVLATLRSDRNHFTAGEKINIEAWLSNDLNDTLEGYSLNYQLEKKNKILFAHSIKPEIEENSSTFQGYISFDAPKTNERTAYTLRMGLFDEKGNEVSQSVLELDVFPEPGINGLAKIFTADGNSDGLLSDLSITPVAEINNSDVILINDYGWYQKNLEAVDRLVQSGKTALFMELPEGNYNIAGSEVSLFNTIMGNYYFVSPTTGHELVKWAKPLDFKCWFNEQEKVIAPFIATVLKAGDWTAILSTGQTSWGSRDEGQFLAVAEKKSGEGKYIICQLQLNNRVTANPVARKFTLKLLGL